MKQKRLAPRISTEFLKIAPQIFDKFQAHSEGAASDSPFLEVEKDVISSENPITKS